MSNGPAALDFAPGSNVKLGPMKKKCNGWQKWAVRYLILDKEKKILYYYHTPKDPSPKEALDLNVCTLARITPQEGNNNPGFRITVDGGRDYIFIGTNSIIVDEWYDAITQTKGDGNTEPGVPAGENIPSDGMPSNPNGSVAPVNETAGQITGGSDQPQTDSAQINQSPTSPVRPPMGMGAPGMPPGMAPGMPGIPPGMPGMPPGMAPGMPGMPPGMPPGASWNGPTLAVFTGPRGPFVPPPGAADVPMPGMPMGMRPPMNMQRPQMFMPPPGQMQGRPPMDATLVGAGHGGGDANSTLVQGQQQQQRFTQAVPVVVMTPDNKRFPPIERPVVGILKIGRYVGNQAEAEDLVTFKSKVISRNHAEIWAVNGEIYIRDTKSQSGTFLNAMRLSEPSKESKPYRLKSGDVIQFGIDYKGAVEDNSRCISVRIDLKTKYIEAAGGGGGAPAEGATLIGGQNNKPNDATLIGAGQGGQPGPIPNGYPQQMGGSFGPGNPMMMRPPMGMPPGMMGRPPMGMPPGMMGRPPMGMPPGMMGMPPGMMRPPMGMPNGQMR